MFSEIKRHPAVIMIKELMFLSTGTTKMQETEADFTLKTGK